MLRTERVAIPAPIEGRLKRSAAFVENIMDFAREDLIGFRRPLAATFAFTAPIVMALSYQAAGIETLWKIAASYALVAFGGLWMVGREAWPALVDEYEARATAKRRAVADLRCGFGESSCLTLARTPRFFEYDGGVLIFADAGDFKTLFLSVESDDADPRWRLYADGEMHRKVWRWLRLPVSREVVKFSAEASKLPAVRGDPKKIKTIDSFEAIHASLGEPLDGAVIHRPFDEVVESVERML